MDEVFCKTLRLLLVGSSILQVIDITGKVDIFDLVSVFEETELGVGLINSVLI